MISTLLREATWSSGPWYIPADCATGEGKTPTANTLFLSPSEPPYWALTDCPLLQLLPTGWPLLGSRPLLSLLGCYVTVAKYQACLRTRTAWVWLHLWGSPPHISLRRWFHLKPSVRVKGWRRLSRVTPIHYCSHPKLQPSHKACHGEFFRSSSVPRNIVEKLPPNTHIART